MSDNNNKSASGAAEISVCKGKDHEDKSKQICALQSQTNVPKSRRTGGESMRNGKKREKERQREDWGQAVAEKLSFTLVNKQEGWGEQSANQQY